MKKLLLLCLLSVSLASVFSQPVTPQSIEDSVIGWMKIYNYKGAKEPLKVDNKLYSVAQLSICDSFANWMQASYIPKGGLGDVKKAVSEKLGLYNQSTAAKPQRYGAYVKTYTELKYNSNRKLEPLSNSHLLWGIMANSVYGTPADALCTPDQFYFTQPSFVEQGYSDELEKLYDLSGHPVLKRFPAYFQRNSETGNEKMVLLSKDNKYPFIKITKGEYLQITEAAIIRLYDKEKKRIHETEKGRQRNIDYFMKYLDANHEKRIACLKNNKEKYKNRLQETAEIFTTEPNAMLENFPDIFEGSGASRLKLPVYKVDPSIAALCKSNQPQWILVYWTASINEPVGKQLHEAIINNFNFEYVYNFFFSPEKVKGQPYKPLRSPSFKEALVVQQASATTNKNVTDKAIHFFEDFSTTTPGKTPVDWKASLGFDGTSAVITRPDGLDGQWVAIKDHRLAPKQLKRSLPQDFTFSYDLAVAQNFTWGAKGLTVQLSKELSPGNAESYLLLKLRPGDGGGNGEAMLETKFPFPPGYSNESKWLVAPGFSNNKKINRITITIKKSGESLQVFIDNNKIIEYEKAIPAAHSFNALSFFSGNRNERDLFYISNIKIEKL